MPAGIPVATMGIGKAGASNAAVLAIQILALNNPPLAQRLHNYKKQLAKDVEQKDRKLKKERHV
jgi:phosphoribosylamine--glycine ligase